MIIFWAAAAVVFILVELATIGLASIWFAIGALCALIAAALGAPIWLQITCFIVISAAALYLTRPLVKKYINSKTLPTNADRVLGQVCIVTESIDNLTGQGAVWTDGKSWTARSADGAPIEKDARVVVRSIEGVKLIVEKTTD